MDMEEDAGGFPAVDEHAPAGFPAVDLDEVFTAKKRVSKARARRAATAAAPPPTGLV